MLYTMVKVLEFKLKIFQRAYILKKIILKKKKNSIFSFLVLS